LAPALNFIVLDIFFAPFALASLEGHQGDQIGRIFASYWAIVSLGTTFENYSSSPFLAIFFRGTSYVKILTKEALGYIWGDFFANSSGVDVMITIFYDFCQFSSKKWRFSQKPML
jgi:hypothetical protein